MTIREPSAGAPVAKDRASESRVAWAVELVPRPLAAAAPTRGLARRRPLFLRWLVLQAVVATLLAAAAIAYGERLQGASLAMVPLILAVLAGASGYAGVLAWRADDGGSPAAGIRHVWFAAGVCQLLG